jgi:DNA mismatch repair protein MSH5
VGELITQTVDFAESEIHHRTIVLQGVDAELDRIRHSYDGLDGLLTNIVNQLVQELPEWAGEYVKNCIFFPQLGFLTVVTLDPATGKGQYEGTDDDVWDRMFVTENMGYYKNKRMKEIDLHLGDVYGQVCGMIIPFPTVSMLTVCDRQRN